MSLPLKDFRLGITDEIDLALEASAIALGQDKAAVARQVLHEWARRKAHEHRVYGRLLMSHGVGAEVSGIEAEDDGSRRSGRR